MKNRTKENLYLCFCVVGCMVAAYRTAELAFMEPCTTYWVCYGLFGVVTMGAAIILMEALRKEMQHG